MNSNNGSSSSSDLAPKNSTSGSTIGTSTKRSWRPKFIESIIEAESVDDNPDAIKHRAKKRKIDEEDRIYRAAVEREKARLDAIRKTRREVEEFRKLVASHSEIRRPKKAEEAQKKSEVPATKDGKIDEGTENDQKKDDNSEETERSSLTTDKNNVNAEALLKQCVKMDKAESCHEKEEKVENSSENGKNDTNAEKLLTEDDKKDGAENDPEKDEKIGDDSGIERNGADSSIPDPDFTDLAGNPLTPAEQLIAMEQWDRQIAEHYRVHREADRALILEIIRNRPPRVYQEGDITDEQVIAEMREEPLDFDGAWDIIGPYLQGFGSN